MKPKEIKRIIGIEPSTPGLHVFSWWALPRLGLPLIGKILKNEGYEVRIYCSDLNRIDWDNVWRADLVLISSITNTASEAYRIAEKIRSRNILVVLGGSHVTFKPAEALRFADYVVRGEGEKTIVELLTWLRDSDHNIVFDIKGLSFRMNGRIYHNPPRPFLQDLNTLPFPDLSLIDGIEKIKVVPMSTSRGCPFDCTFCSVTKMFGRKYRFRNNLKVIEEIEKLSREFPNRSFFFYDDNFTASSRRTKALLKEILKRRIAIRWSAQVRADVAKDEKLIALMRRAGCFYLFIGLESINPNTLKDYKKRQTVEDIEECIRILHEHDIRVHGMFVLGGDNDDLATINDTASFALRRDIDTVQFSILTPFPGTNLYREMISQGRIIDEKWSEYDGHHVKFKPRRISSWKLQVATMPGAMVKFYSLWQCLKLLLKGERSSVYRIYGRWLLWRWRKHNRRFLKSLRNFSRSQILKIL
jgi:anaerobic magnesium-protoporphyrin IX monomethyl ester cyclase